MAKANRILKASNRRAGGVKLQELNADPQKCFARQGRRRSAGKWRSSTRQEHELSLFFGRAKKASRRARRDPRFLLPSEAPPQEKAPVAPKRAICRSNLEICSRGA
jgi:hypothetical protein